jgi:hypothetical protein
LFDTSHNVARVAREVEAGIRKLVLPDVTMDGTQTLLQKRTIVRRRINDRDCVFLAGGRPLNLQTIAEQLSQRNWVGFRWIGIGHKAVLIDGYIPTTAAAILAISANATKATDVAGYKCRT